MAPEVYAELPYNGLKADVFSLGVILFILLTRYPPFETASPTDPFYSFITKSSSTKQGLQSLLKFLKINNLSNQAVDLLSKMLCPERTRISISEVIKHPFMDPFVEQEKQTIVDFQEHSHSLYCEDSSKTFASDAIAAAAVGGNVDVLFQNAELPAAGPAVDRLICREAGKEEIMKWTRSTTPEAIMTSS